MRCEVLLSYLLDIISSCLILNVGAHMLIIIAYVFTVLNVSYRRVHNFSTIVAPEVTYSYVGACIALTPIFGSLVYLT